MSIIDIFIEITNDQPAEIRPLFHVILSGDIRIVPANPPEKGPYYSALRSY